MEIRPQGGLPASSQPWSPTPASLPAQSPGTHHRGPASPGDLSRQQRDGRPPGPPLHPVLWGSELLRAGGGLGLDSPCEAPVVLVGEAFLPGWG